MENYYIYTTSYGNGAITYCGAGHGSVTGPTTRNNDERKLFINVIVNSAEAVKENLHYMFMILIQISRKKWQRTKRYLSQLVRPYIWMK